MTIPDRGDTMMPGLLSKRARWVDIHSVVKVKRRRTTKSHTDGAGVAVLDDFDGNVVVVDARCLRVDAGKPVVAASGVVRSLECASAAMVKGERPDTRARFVNQSSPSAALGVFFVPTLTIAEGWKLVAISGF